jgi:hypothetical protein
MNKSGTPIVEAFREMGRYILLGIVAWLLAGGIEVLLGFFEATLSFEIRSVIITLLTIALRGVDKYMHLEGKSQSTIERESILLKGLTRF